MIQTIIHRLLKKILTNLYELLKFEYKFGETNDFIRFWINIKYICIKNIKDYFV